MSRERKVWRTNRVSGVSGIRPLWFYLFYLHFQVRFPFTGSEFLKPLHKSGWASCFLVHVWQMHGMSTADYTPLCPQKGSLYSCNPLWFPTEPRNPSQNPSQASVSDPYNTNWSVLAHSLNPSIITPVLALFWSFLLSSSRPLVMCARMS